MLDIAQDAPPARLAPDAGRTLRRFYAYRLLSEAQFTSAIWIIFLRHRGFSLTEIGFAEAAFHLAPVLLEIPSGSFADLIGRRWSLAGGMLLVAASSALIFGAHTLPFVMLAMFIQGASFSFRSGADQAYLFEALGDRQHGFAGILGKLLGVSYLVAALTASLGGALSDWSYAWPYGLTIGFALAGAWLAASLAEPPRAPRTSGMAHSLRGHAREAWTLIVSRRDVAGLLVFSGPFWAASTIAFLYFQAAFADRGLSNAAIGLTLGAVTVVNAVGAASAAWFERRGRFARQIIVLTSVTGAGIVGTAAHSLPLAIGAYFVANLASGLIEPVLYAWFNRQLPSEQRATLLSVESWVFSLTMIVAFPAGGWLAGQYGWGMLYVLCGAVKIGLALLMLAATLRGASFDAEPAEASR